MAHRSTMSRHWFNTLSIVLGGMLLAACTRTTAFATEPRAVTSQVNVTQPAKPRTPTGITIVAVAKATASATSTLKPQVAAATNQVILQGRVYDAGQGLQRRLSNATLEWQFFTPDWQQYNGRLPVPDDGLYRLLLPIRASDEVIITAHAPGYFPSTAHIYGNQLSAYGSRLNFGLVSDRSVAPTLPGDLGTIQLHGIVYNSARGLKSPIEQATITIVNNSVVQPSTQIEITANLSGTFDLMLELHTTDQIDVTIAAQGYLTQTLSKSAKDLAKHPQLSIGLRPAPKTK
jgi:hypothetical protein